MKTKNLIILLVFCTLGISCSQSSSRAENSGEEISLSANVNDLESDYPKSRNENPEIIQHLQGTWFHDQDSAAYVKINNDRFIFGYLDQESTDIDTFNIKISNHLPDIESEVDNSDYLILTNLTDTMHYEIMGVNDSTLSLMYLPVGRIHVYKK